MIIKQKLMSDFEIRGETNLPVKSTRGEVLKSPDMGVTHNDDINIFIKFSQNFGVVPF